MAAKANSTLKNLLSYKRLRYSTSVRTYWSSIENSSACSSWSKKRPLASCTPPCTLKIEARPVRPPQPSNYWTWLWQREDPTLQICKTNRRNSIWDWLTVLTIEIVSKFYQNSIKMKLWLNQNKFWHNLDKVRIEINTKKRYPNFMFILKILQKITITSG